MKKLWMLLLTCLFVLGCGEDDAQNKNAPKIRYTIGVSVPAATHGWTGGVLWNAEQAKKEIEAQNPDIQVIVTTGVNTAEQANRIEDLISRKVDALVVLSQEPEPLFPACKAAKKAGIYLVIVSNPLPEGIQDHFVNGDNRSFGEQAAMALGQAIHKKGRILMLEGFANPINTERVNGFKTVLERQFPDIKLVDSKYTDWNTEKGFNAMQDLLQKHREIDGVWAGDDDVLVGALKAYQKAQRADVRAMVGGGGSKIMIKKIMDNNSLVKATVTYSPAMIKVGIGKAVEFYKNGKKTAPDARRETLIPSEIISLENAKNYYQPESVY